MAIDPMMYKKYSGRSSDPYSKMGEALAKSSARKQKLSGRSSESPAMFGLKAQWWFSIITSIAALIILLTMMM